MRKKDTHKKTPIKPAGKQRLRERDRWTDRQTDTLAGRRAGRQVFSLTTDFTVINNDSWVPK